MSQVITRAAVVRPRDAASLLIYRRQGTEVQVLMGKRRPGARFLPDVYVFPGGALDAADVLSAVDALAAQGGASGSRTGLTPSWVKALAARDDVHVDALLQAAQ